MPGTGNAATRECCRGRGPDWPCFGGECDQFNTKPTAQERTEPVGAPDGGGRQPVTNGSDGRTTDPTGKE